MSVVEEGVGAMVAGLSGSAEGWGPQGIEFARFHLCGDLNVVIYGPAPGVKDVQLEVLSGLDYGDGQGHVTSTVLRLPKARARALASAIMGAAAEL